jgi:Uma2 family endonuclease
LTVGLTRRIPLSYLVVELADTALDFDLADKRALYSSAGVAEYWGIDLQAKKLTRLVEAGVEQPVSW